LDVGRIATHAARQAVGVARQRLLRNVRLAAGHARRLRGRARPAWCSAATSRASPSALCAADRSSSGSATSPQRLERPFNILTPQATSLAQASRDR